MLACSGMVTRVCACSVAQLAGRPSHQKLLKRNRQLTTDFYWASVEVERCNPERKLSCHCPDYRADCAHMAGSKPKSLLTATCFLLRFPLGGFARFPLGVRA